jgi:type I restriction enzyme, S subunit
MTTSDWISQEFERLADSSKSTKELRSFILQLAVQGKLVPQDPKDEPASVLLRRIWEEKQQLIAKGEIKKSKPIPAIKKNEVPFEIPKVWSYCRLGEILIDLKNGITGKQNKIKGHYRVTRIETISFSRIDLNRTGFIESISDRERKRHLLINGDILFSHINSDIHLGKTALFDLDDELYHGVNLLLLRTITKFIVPKFLNIFCNARRFDGFFMSIAQKSVQQSSINQKNLLGIVFSLPPLAEQKRIVAKVDELMNLCDAFEAKQTSKAELKEALNIAALDRINNAQSEEDLESATNFYIGQMDRLVTKAEAVKPLRETILQLAVQGKLVPQDPNDEPASELLKRIEEEKEKLIAEGTIKKSKSIPVDNEKDDKIELPINWTVTLLDNITSKLGAGSTPLGGKKAYTNKGISFLRSQNVYNNGLILNGVAKIPNSTHQKMSGTHVKPEDLLLNITGASIGRCAVVPNDFDEGNVSQHVAIIRLIDKSLANYVHIWFICPLIQKKILDVQVGVSREGLSMKRLKEFRTPLPPLAEQKRIVAKVDELMSICDQLETKLTHSQSLNERFTQAVLSSAA